MPNWPSLARQPRGWVYSPHPLELESLISDLSPIEVRALAASLELSLDPDDTQEVTHRLNAFLHALGPLVSLPLGDLEPSPVDPNPRS